MDLLSIVPVTCFAYQTHEVLVPIYCNLKERNATSLVKATSVCMVTLFIIYSAMGIFGFLAFGRSVKPDIMQMFDGQRPEVLIGERSAQPLQPLAALRDFPDCQRLYWTTQL